MSRSVFPYKAIQPCLPKPAKEPPAGPDWIHEIKHDGFRILARRDGNSVRLYTRNGYNFADRFPRIVEAVKTLSVQSCFIDGEAIVVDANGLAVFELLRSCRYNHEYIAGGFNKTTSLTGDAPPNRVVVIKYPGVDAAKTWWQENKHMTDKAEKFANFRIYVVEGVEAK